MAVVRGLLRIPMGRGIDQSNDPRLDAPGTTGEARNVVIDRAGRFRKRTGWGRLPRTDENGVSLQGGPERVDPTGAELLQADDSGRLLAWGPGRARWELIGYLPPFSAESHPLVRSQASIISGALTRFGASDKYELIVWQYALSGDGGALRAYAQIRDTETGALIGRDSLVYPAALTYPVTFTVGTSAWVVHAFAPTVKIQRYSGDLATFPTYEVSATEAIAFDAAPVDNGTHGLVALAQVSGDYRVEVYVLSETGSVLFSSFSIAPGVADVAVSQIAVCGAPGGEYRVLVRYAGGSGYVLELWRLDSDLAVIGDVIGIESAAYEMTSIGVCCDVDGNDWVHWYGKLEETDRDALHVRCAFDGNSTAETWRKIVWRAGPQSRAKLVNDGVFLPVFAESTGTLSDGLHLAMVRLDNEFSDLPPAYAGVVLRQVVAGSIPTQHWVSVGDGEYQLGAVVITRAQKYGADVNGVDRVTLTENRSRQAAVSLPQQHIWGGAGLWGYDGYDCHDVNFLQAPQLLQLGDPYTTSGGGIGLFPEGKYLYRARYEFVDDAGVMHVSPWSNDLEVDLTGITNAVSINVDIATTQLTQHGRRASYRSVSVAIYRTDTNGAAAGVAIFYRLTSYGLDALKAPYNVATVAYVDDQNDAPAAGLGSILSSGGLLEARVLPPVTALCVHQGRLFAAAGEPDRAIWFSQSLQTDETPRWHEQLRLQVTDSPEPIVALASLDANLVAFTSKGICTWTGIGPTDTGQEGSFSGPYPVASAFGCTDPGSLVTSSRGVYFRSAAGICLLSRSLEVTVVSDPVRDLLEQTGAEIRHATYHEAEARVVFHLAAGSASQLLIFDERHGQWTRADSNELTSITHLAYDRGHAALVFAAGHGVYREGYGTTPGFDGPDSEPTWFGAEIGCSWVRGGEVASWTDLSVVHLEGEACAPSTWRIKIERDYETTGAQTLDLDLTAVTRGARVVKQIGPATRTAQAFRITLTEQVPSTLPSDTTAPQSVLWWGCSVEVGLLPGLARIDLNNRGGVSLWLVLFPFFSAALAPWLAACSAGLSARASAWPQARPSAATSTAPTTRPTRSTPTRSTRACTTRASSTRSATRPASRPPAPGSVRPRRPTGACRTPTGPCRWGLVSARWGWPTTSRPSSGASGRAWPSSSSRPGCSRPSRGPPTRRRTSGAAPATNSPRPRTPPGPRSSPGSRPTPSRGSSEPRKRRPPAGSWPACSGRPGGRTSGSGARARAKPSSGRKPPCSSRPRTTRSSAFTSSCGSRPRRPRPRRSRPRPRPSRGPPAPSRASTPSASSRPRTARLTRSPA